MDFRASRLRSGEIIAGIAAVILLVDLLVLSWYSVSGGSGASATGWEALSVLRWLMLATVLAALALVILQGTRRAPALPASFSVIAIVLGAVTSLALIYRVLIEIPGPARSVSQKPGAYLALLSALALTYGAFRSLREEEPSDPERAAAIPTVSIGHRP